MIELTLCKFHGHEPDLPLQSAGQEEYKGQDDAHAVDGGRTGRVDAAHIQTGRMVYGRAWHPERRGVQALGRVPGMLHAAAYRQLRDEGRYGTASGIPEAERYQRHDSGAYLKVEGSEKM